MPTNRGNLDSANNTPRHRSQEIMEFASNESRPRCDRLASFFIHYLETRDTQAEYYIPLIVILSAAELAENTLRLFHMNLWTILVGRNAKVLQ